LLHSRASGGKAHYNWKVLFSGYAPAYAYEIARLDTRLPFAELRRQATHRISPGASALACRCPLQTSGEQVTYQGLHKLGSGTVDAGGGKTPGVAALLTVTIATANPSGLIIVGTAKMGGGVSGKSTIEGTASQTVKKIADELRVTFQR
jgi:hypothetical protein